MKKVKTISTELMMAAVTVVLFIVLSLLSSSFLTFDNLTNVARQISFVAIAAIGMTFVIINGNIDLSIGAIIALTSIVTCGIDVGTKNVPLAFLGALITGILCGAFNGFFVAYRKIPAFIVTMATMQIFRGIIHLYTNSQPIYGLTQTLTTLGRGAFLTIPIPAVIMLVMFVLGHIVLRKTVFGKYVYAVGGNKEAARLAGIKTNVVELLSFVIIGLCAGISGFLLSGRMGIGQPNVATGWELDVIAAVYLGGARINGGAGSLMGTFIGALIMGIISNGLNLVGTSYYLELMLKGAIIIIALEINHLKSHMGTPNLKKLK